MVDETAKILAKGLSLVACVVNPQVFVIGGGMSKAGDFLIEQVQKYYQEYAFHACKIHSLNLQTSAMTQVFTVA